MDTPGPGPDVSRVSTSSSEFEFARMDDPTSTADELFYNGKILPLELAPRLAAMGIQPEQSSSSSSSDGSTKISEMLKRGRSVGASSRTPVPEGPCTRKSSSYPPSGSKSSNIFRDLFGGGSHCKKPDHQQQPQQSSSKMSSSKKLLKMMFPNWSSSSSSSSSSTSSTLLPPRKKSQERNPRVKPPRASAVMFADGLYHGRASAAEGHYHGHSRSAPASPLSPYAVMSVLQVPPFNKQIPQPQPPHSSHQSPQSSPYHHHRRKLVASTTTNNNKSIAVS